ncbi:hypothetical protein LZC95_39445 [Pendulispora brunnea]|uniref:Uncharacterized protein n=1 Tax=Pendulispora brunnea TaxID=2905690 RepID=A0ABZ2K582_9BACT
MESMTATARIGRWEGPDAVPVPLRESASKLAHHLDAAKRLAGGIRDGRQPATAAASLNAMSGALGRLDAAHLEYRRRIDEAPAQSREAALDLDGEVDTVKSESHTWG